MSTCPTCGHADTVMELASKIELMVSYWEDGRDVTKWADVVSDALKPHCDTGRSVETDAEGQLSPSADLEFREVIDTAIVREGVEPVAYNLKFSTPVRRLHIVLR